MKKNDSFLLSLEPNEGKPDQASSITIMKDLLIPFGVFLVGAVGFLAGYEKLPGWALGVVIAYLAFTIAISLAPPAKWIFRWYMGRRTEKKLSRSFRLPFKGIAREFDELTENNRANTILYVLQQLNGWDEFRGEKLALSSVNCIREWLESTSERLETGGNVDFKLVASDLSRVIYQYHYLCVRSQEHLEQLINAKSLVDQRLRQLKQQWNTARGEHMHVLRNWEQVAKRFNEMAGERVCLDYYEPIKTFE